MVVTAGVAATDVLQVTDNTTIYPAGRKAGFLMSNPGSLLSLNLLSNVTIDTLQGSTVQETATVKSLLNLEALGLFADPDEAYVFFQTTKPFNSVRLRTGALLSLLSTLNVYGACVTLQ